MGAHGQQLATQLQRCWLLRGRRRRLGGIQVGLRRGHLELEHQHLRLRQAQARVGEQQLVR